jgi:hypothetical protein
LNPENKVAEISCIRLKQLMKFLVLADVVAHVLSIKSAAMMIEGSQFYAQKMIVSTALYVEISHEK